MNKEVPWPPFPHYLCKRELYRIRKAVLGDEDLGPVEETNRWMVSIEGHVVTEGESFTFGLATLFSSFYNFSLQYQDEAHWNLFKDLLTQNVDQRLTKEKSPASELARWCRRN